MRAALRIAALQPSISITLDRLGALDTLVACTRYCVEAVPALTERSLIVVKDSWSCTTEEILGARPTLVLASVPYRMESLAALLKAGCPVVSLAPHTLADIYSDIHLLGSIVHRVDAAETLVAEMEQEIAATQERASAAGSRPRVYCEEWGKPLIHSQPWVAELVHAAGGQFVGESAKQTTAEAIAAADPDVLIFAWCGAGNRVPLQRVIAQRGWHDLRAVRNGRIFCIADEWLNTPAPTLLLGLRALAAAIHPSASGTKDEPPAFHTVAKAGITI
ncbi:MAG TPA: ABC transporter substrate-binding protein [Acidobacteriaceae bacterium]